MILRIISCFALLCFSVLSTAAQPARNNHITTILRQQSAPITVLSNSKIIQDFLKKNKKIMNQNNGGRHMPVSGKKLIRSKAGVYSAQTNDAAIRKKNGANKTSNHAKSIVVNLKLPENQPRKTNSTSRFVFNDITQRSTSASKDRSDLPKRINNVERLRQAAVRR